MFGTWLAARVPAVWRVHYLLLSEVLSVLGMGAV